MSNQRTRLWAASRSLSISCLEVLTDSSSLQKVLGFVWNWTDWNLKNTTSHMIRHVINHMINHHKAAALTPDPRPPRDLEFKNLWSELPVARRRSFLHHSVQTFSVCSSESAGAVATATACIISPMMTTSCRHWPAPLPVTTDQSRDTTGGLHAETLTSRRAMAVVVPAAAEAVAVAAGCGCGEGEGEGDGEGGTMDRAGPFWLVGAVLVWNRICCNVRLRFGCRRRWVWLKISTATHFITPATRSSYSGTVYILDVCREETARTLSLLTSYNNNNKNLETVFSREFSPNSAPFSREKHPDGPEVLNMCADIWRIYTEYHVCWNKDFINTTHLLEMISLDQLSSCSCQSGNWEFSCAFEEVWTK